MSYVRTMNERIFFYRIKKSRSFKIYLYNFNPEITHLNKKKYVPTKKDIYSSESFIIENNENFVVINKPPGVPVQGGTKSYKNLVDTLSNSDFFKNSKP